MHADAGEQLTIHLSHLNVDDDLVVFGPGIAPLRTPHPGAAAPFAGEVPFDLGQRTQSITPEALTDVPQEIGRATGPRRLRQPRPRRRRGVRRLARGRDVHDPGLELRRRLQQRSLDAARRDLVGDSAAGHVYEPAGPGTGVVKPMPPVPANASTLYLVASKRFGDLYGLQAENDVWARLQTLAARSDAAGGAVIPVDANTRVLNALNARAADSCSPAKANDVVRAVGNLLDNPLIVRPSVKYIVVVGDDAAGIPFGRVLDNTAYANERGYASTFYGNTNNQYLSSYGLGFLPTDDPLGDVNYSGEGPYVPELAVGRLVETPAQISSQISQYITRNGAIAPTRALTTGYDFLTDGSTQISAGFKARLGTDNAQELITNSWSKTNLLNAMFPTSNPPTIDSLNAHYDHFRALPADENAAHRETILYTTADLAGRSTTGRVIFTMGCHSALPVSDFVFGNPTQERLGAGLLADRGRCLHGQHRLRPRRHRRRALLGEAEHPLRRPPRRLDDGRPGACVRQAGIRGDADPQRLPPEGDRPGDDDGPADVPDRHRDHGAAADAGDHDHRLGDRASHVAVQRLPELHQGHTTAIGDYYRSDDSFAENRRPIEPTAKLDVTQPGLVAHGALLTGLTSTDESDFDAAFSRVVDDLSGFTPELVGDVSYPTKLQSIATILGSERAAPATRALHRAVPERRHGRGGRDRHPEALHSALGQRLLHASGRDRFHALQLRPGRGDDRRRHGRFRR